MRSAALVLAVLAACAGSGARRLTTGEPTPTGTAVETPAANGDRVTFVDQQAVAVTGLGPEILLPPEGDSDAVVARVGSLELRRSHAFARFLTADPKIALQVVDQLVFDVLVARHAREYGIIVQPERVDQLTQGEEQRMKRQVESELGGDMDFGTYVFRMFGMRLDEWRRTLRLRTAQRLYHGYVIRYLALREDRVRVRYIVHRDRSVVAEAVAKVRDGADFATLALRLSEDGRRDGGLLPAFGKSFPSPVTEVAFTLSKGGVSDPFERQVAGESRWFTVYCLDRLAGRDEPFAAVQAEIDRELAANPLTQVEASAYALLWRESIEPAEQPVDINR
ncbi:MAG: peptidyl-prolyl cis-trans isomerase [Planctomycetes bacterium]|nr:peptidyl-prolyl cis-trans isomerase [Planctomycetota bacterium]